MELFDPLDEPLFETPVELFDPLDEPLFETPVELFDPLDEPLFDPTVVALLEPLESLFDSSFSPPQAPRANMATLQIAKILLRIFFLFKKRRK